MTTFRTTARKACAAVLVVLGAANLCGCQFNPLELQSPTDPVATAVFADANAAFPETLFAVQAPETIEPPQSPAAPSLWRNMRSRMLLDHFLEEKRVQQEIAWLQRNPRYLHRLEARMQRYLPYIFEQTQLRDFPAEIALLPIVESALDPFAFSHGGASGPWQFVRGTARQYGLSIDDWYDGRRDIIASTEAALDYLTALHKRFDDWYLALAGYNAGEGNVARARRKNPSAGFFDLRLPRETRAYVPRLLALADVVARPEHYGLTLPPIDPTVGIGTIATHSQFDLAKLADITGVALDDLYQWNPALNQWATPPRGPHRLILPATTDLESLQQAVDAVPASARVDWTEVTIKPGDTLIKIARRNGTDVASLQRANQLTNHRIRAGHKLLIPKNPTALSNVPRKSRGRSGTYLAQAGDSMWSVAKKHGVRLDALMRANDIGPKDTLAVGRKLVVPGIAPNGRSVVRKVRYKVRNGDSLSRIATKFKVSVQEIANWNNLDPKRYLQPGQGLLLYVNVVGG